MAKKTKNIIMKEEILWHDRKRILGMPISFTKYMVDKDRFTTSMGLFTTETNEILLYRILDLKLIRTFGQKLCGVGTIILYSADQSNQTFEVKNVKKPETVRKFLSRIIETQRTAKGLAGREIYGAAGLINNDNDDAVHAFVDVDGDGIPE